MELENENNPAPVEEAQELSPKPEAEAEVEQSDEAPEDQASDEDQAEPAEEFEEVERNGKKFRIPKELAPELLMQADYTRKAQEVAEQRRQIEAAREEYEQEVQFREATFQETAALANIEQRLANFQNTDWRRWHMANAQEAAAAQAEYMSLQGEHARLANIVQAKRAHIASQREQETAISLTKEVEALSKPNPTIGWDGKFDRTRSAELTQFITKNFGIPPEEQAKAARKAGWVQMANAARIGIEALQKQRQTPRVAEAQPAAKVPTSRSAPTSDPRKMSVEQLQKVLYKR